MLSGLTYQYEVASNEVTVHTRHRDVVCRIITATFNEIKCVTMRYTAGERDREPDAAGGGATLGHSGGGVNGYVRVEVNGHAAWGVGEDPNVVAAGDSSRCRCKGEWSSPVDGAECAKVQRGCPSAACDADVQGSWCLVANTGCAGMEDEAADEEGWAYCSTSPIKLAGETSGVIIEDRSGAGYTAPATVSPKTAAEAAVEKARLLDWVDLHRADASLCVSPLLNTVAQAHAERMSAAGRLLVAGEGEGQGGDTIGVRASQAG